MDHALSFFSTFSIAVGVGRFGVGPEPTLDAGAGRAPAAAVDELDAAPGVREALLLLALAFAAGGGAEGSRLAARAFASALGTEAARFGSCFSGIGAGPSFGLASSSFFAFRVHREKRLSSRLCLGYF